MQSTRNLDFGDHRRILWDNRYIYPVVSRRSKGLSIGVNLNPDKVCNFDCPYCQVDRTTPGGKRDVDLVVLESELDALLALAASGEIWEHKPFDTVAPHLRRVNDVAFAGDGEPTTCKQFQGALELVGTLLERHGPRLRPGPSFFSPCFFASGTWVHRTRRFRPTGTASRRFWTLAVRSSSSKFTASPAIRPGPSYACCPTPSWSASLQAFGPWA